MAQMQTLPIVCLIVLVISSIIYAVGLALPYWYQIAGGVNGGLWHVCGDESGPMLGPGMLEGCNRLQYDNFRIPSISESDMPVAWIVTQALLCAGLGCVVVSVIAFIIWLMDGGKNRSAVLVAVSFYLLAGCFGAAGVIAFGIYWNELPDGYAFWLVVGGAACWLFMGCICTITQVCTCENCGKERIVRIVRRAPFIHRAPSDVIPVLRKPVRAQVPVAVPIQRAIEYVEPAPQIAPQVIINTPQCDPHDLHVSTTYNGSQGGYCDCGPPSSIGGHSATVYVDGGCSTMGGGGGSGCYQTGSIYRY